METFGERLKEERKRLGMNQADFAVLGGVQRTAQINYEKDERSPDVAFLQNVAAHGVDVLYLITGIRNAERLSDEQNALLVAYQNASGAVRSAALAALLADATPSAVKQTIKGNVGQAVSGDLNVSGGQSFSFGETKKNK